MKLFPHGHATHPDWRMAFDLAAAQVEALSLREDYADEPTVGILYFTEPYAAHAEALLAAARERFVCVQHWVGSVAIGVAASGVEYFDEPALTLMLADLPLGSFRLFSGSRPLPASLASEAHTALIHADPQTPELAELIGEMSSRVATGYLFGGLASARHTTLTVADEVLKGGLSGIAFDETVPLISRVTQGCLPIGAARSITALDQNLVLELDGRPALDVLFKDLGLDPDRPGFDAREALPRLRNTLVGLTPAGAVAIGAGRGAFGADTRVRHLIGLDPVRQAVAVADLPELGTQLAFCTRHVDAARRDLTRICAEIREELEPEELPLPVAAALAGDPATSEPHPARRIAGAIYVSCAGRGGPHFGAPSAEMQWIKHHLGDVPLVGFFAGGEIARHHLYGYTGVLTVFATD
jgi:small ligand-binding sensory domain FIST